MKSLCSALFLCCALLTAPVFGEAPVRLTLSRAELTALWRERIDSFLAQGVIPIIDLESSMSRKDGERDLPAALKAMDEAGVALMALDGYQAETGETGGYRWGYYIHELVNAHPDRFILATNGGTNSNWFKGKGGDPRHFMDQTEAQARTGDYPIMGEFEFRHYMSSSQCKAGRTDRDVTIPMTSPNGQRLFALSRDTGLAFLVHLEPEDQSLKELEEMLAAYPGAKVIVCHFGQIRHPDRESRFSAAYARDLLGRFPNLYFDLSVGEPGRHYPCGKVLDTVLWETKGKGQKGKLKPEYRKLLGDYSTRFVSGFDFGGGRKELDRFIPERAANIRLIIRDLPESAQRDIAYRNAWKLLTGSDWR